MTKTHKDIAVFMVQLAENDSLSEQQVVREIADKTRELLRQLRSVFWCFCIWPYELSGVQNTHKYFDTAVQRWHSICMHLSSEIWSGNWHVYWLTLGLSQHTTYNINYALMQHVSTQRSHHQATLKPYWGVHLKCAQLLCTPEYGFKVAWWWLLRVKTCCIKA